MNFSRFIILSAVLLPAMSMGVARADVTLGMRGNVQGSASLDSGASGTEGIGGTVTLDNIGEDGGTQQFRASGDTTRDGSRQKVEGEYMLGVGIDDSKESHGTIGKNITGIVLDGRYERNMLMGRPDDVLFGAGYGGDWDTIVTRGRIRTMVEGGKDVAHNRVIAQERVSADAAICAPVSDDMRKAVCIDLDGAENIGWLQIGVSGGFGLSYRQKISDQSRWALNEIEVSARGEGAAELDRDGGHAAATGMVTLEAR